MSITMKKTCDSCLKPNATLECVACHDALCKYCAEAVEKDQFELLHDNSIQFGVYCPNCFLSQVSDKKNEYNRIVELAKDLHIFDKSQGKETRLMKREEEPISVENCKDQSDVFMKLAYQAAAAGFNALIDVDVKAVKVRTNSYQTYVYKGTGVPTMYSKGKEVKDRSIWQNPN